MTLRFTETHRSLIVLVTPDTSFAVRFRDGRLQQAPSAPFRPDVDNPWLHLFDDDHGIRWAWYPTDTRLLAQAPAYNRERVVEAVAAVADTGRPAMLVWELAQRKRRITGEPYGAPHWIPVGHILATEQDLAAGEPS